MLSKEIQEEESNGIDKMRKDLSKWGQVVTAPRYQERPGKQPPFVKKTLGDAANQEASAEKAYRGNLSIRFPAINTPQHAVN